MVGVAVGKRAMATTVKVGVGLLDAFLENGRISDRIRTLHRNQKHPKHDLKTHAEQSRTRRVEVVGATAD